MVHFIVDGIFYHPLAWFTARGRFLPFWKKPFIKIYHIKAKYPPSRSSEQLDIRQGMCIILVHLFYNTMFLLAAFISILVLGRTGYQMRVPFGQLVGRVSLVRTHLSPKRSGMGSSTPTHACAVRAIQHGQVSVGDRIGVIHHSSSLIGLDRSSSLTGLFLVVLAKTITWPVWLVFFVTGRNSINCGWYSFLFRSSNESNQRRYGTLTIEYRTQPLSPIIHSMLHTSGTYSFFDAKCPVLLGAFQK